MAGPAPISVTTAAVASAAVSSPLRAMVIRSPLLLDMFASTLVGVLSCAGPEQSARTERPDRSGSGQMPGPIDEIGAQERCRGGPQQPRFGSPSCSPHPPPGGAVQGQREQQAADAELGRELDRQLVRVEHGPRPLMP